MNERIIKIGLESGMLNYVDNETPRHYFLSGHADEQDLEKFAELIVRECDQYARSTWEHGELLGGDLKQLFGFEE